MTTVRHDDAAALTCVVVKPAAWELLAPAWRLLWRSCSWATPFQHPAWVLAWLDVLAPIDVRLLTFRRHGQLVGIAPLCREATDPEGVLKLAGSGISDYLDMITTDHERPAVLAGLRSWVARQSDVKTVVFSDLPPASPLVDAGPPPPGFDDERRHHDVCPQLTLATNLPETLVAGSRSFATALRRAPQYGLTVREATPATLAVDLTLLMQLHSARQRSLDHEDGAFGAIAVRIFHRLAAAELLADGNAVLYVLEHHGSPIGALYALCDRRRVYTYCQGFDPAAKAHSPGTVLIFHTMRAAIASGRTVLDFLRGTERYKYGYGAQDVPTFTRSWVRRQRS